MKTAKRLIPLLVVILAIMAFGCFHSEKRAVKKAIKNDLDLLKNLDSDTASKYFSYKELFPDIKDDQKQSNEIKDVLPLFFQDFDYKILDVDVDKDKQTASASLRLVTLDANALAKDFTAAKLQREIQSAAHMENDQDYKSSSLSLTDLYLIMKELLASDDYDSIERNCTIELAMNNHNAWEIKRTYALENDLVGGLMTYLSDPDILSPEDTLTVYLDSLTEMNTEEMSSFLGVESILNTSDTTRNAIASALVTQVHNTFNYEFKDSKINGYQAVVTTKITTFDSEAILTSYQKKLNEYLASPDAVIDGLEKRLDKSYDMLLDCITANTATKTADASLCLINDGVSWKLDDSNGELGNAIFGTLTTSPVDDTVTE